MLKQLDATVGRLLATISPAGGRGNAACLRQPEQVLFVRPGGIGDAVLLVPAILALKQRFPGLAVHLLAERRNAAPFDLCPAVSRVFRYDVPKELAAALLNRYDLVIDTEQWHRLSAVITRWTRTLVTIGFATNERGRLFTHPVPYFHDDYEAESFLHLLVPLGISPRMETESRFLTVPAWAETEARRLLGEFFPRPYVVIFPGATIPERRWGADRFAEVAGRLLAAGYGVLVVGGREDVAAGDQIVAAGGVNLAGRSSLAGTAALIAGAAALVSGDSGILHIGVGLDVPTVSLFGPGIAAKWAPRGPRHAVIDKHLSCSPCTVFGTTPRCYRNAECLASISVDEVIQAVLSLLRGQKSTRPE